MGPPSGAIPVRGAHWRASDGQAGLATLSWCSVGPPPAGRGIGVEYIASWVAGNGKDLGMRNPGIADWSYRDSLVGKALELV